MAAADQEARSVAILVAGIGDEDHARRGRRRAGPARRRQHRRAHRRRHGARVGRGGAPSDPEVRRARGGRGVHGRRRRRRPGAAAGRHRRRTRRWSAPASPPTDLRRGVTAAWLGIIGLGVLLLALAAAIAYVAGPPDQRAAARRGRGRPPAPRGRPVRAGGGAAAPRRPRSWPGRSTAWPSAPPSCSPRSGSRSRTSPTGCARRSPRCAWTPRRCPTPRRRAAPGAHRRAPAQHRRDRARGPPAGPHRPRRPAPTPWPSVRDRVDHWRALAEDQGRPTRRSAARRAAAGGGRRRRPGRPRRRPRRQRLRPHRRAGRLRGPRCDAAGGTVRLVVEDEGDGPGRRTPATDRAPPVSASTSPGVRRPRAAAALTFGPRPGGGTRVEVVAAAARAADAGSVVGSRVLVSSCPSPVSSVPVSVPVWCPSWSCVVVVVVPVVVVAVVDRRRSSSSRVVAGRRRPRAAGRRRVGHRTREPSAGRRRGARRRGARDDDGAGHGRSRTSPASSLAGGLQGANRGPLGCRAPLVGARRSPGRGGGFRARPTW